MSDDEQAPADSDSTADEHEKQEEQSPSDQLDVLLFETIDTIEAADRGVDRFKTERKQIEEFGEQAAPLIAENRSLTSGQYASQLNDVCNDWNKTEIRDKIDEYVEEHDPRGEDRPKITEWLEANVERVVEVRSTDRLAQTRWRWEASDPDHGLVSWETKRTGEGIEHNGYEQLQAMVQEATGKYVCDPDGMLRDGGAWKQWVAEFVEDYDVVEPCRGARTAALDRLKEWVKRHHAYRNWDDVVDRGGMHIDPDEGEIHIRNGEIKRWCDAEEITPETFQSELSIRGLLSERVRGASEQTTIKVDGEYQRITYWVFDLGRLGVEPYDMIEDPKTATEQEQEQEQKQEQAESDGDADGDGGADESVEDAAADDDTSPVGEEEWESEQVGSEDPFVEDADTDAEDDASDVPAAEDLDTEDVDPKQELGETWYEFVESQVEFLDAPTAGDIISEFSENFDESDAAAITAVIEDVHGGDDAGNAGDSGE